MAFPSQLVAHLVAVQVPNQEFRSNKPDIYTLKYPICQLFGCLFFNRLIYNSLITHHMPIIHSSWFPAYFRHGFHQLNGDVSPALHHGFHGHRKNRGKPITIGVNSWIGYRQKSCNLTYKSMMTGGNVVQTSSSAPSPSHHHLFVGAMATIPSHGWFMAWFEPHYSKTDIPLISMDIPFR